ncbi:MAG: hypothetical protein H7836_12410 [Magnetococcus sp. YQC-3]
MPKQITVRNIFDVDKFRLSVDDNPLTKHEKEMIILTRNIQQEKVYNNFDNDFNIYLSKLPDSAAKKTIEKLSVNKLIFLGTNSKKDGCLGSPLLSSSNDAIGGVVLDAADFDIELSTGNTSNIDQCVYAAYFNYIRGVVLLKRKEVKQNIELHNLMIEYLKNIIKKSISAPTLNEKQELVFEALVRLFYYEYFLFYDFGMAMDLFVMKAVPKEYQKEIEKTLRTLETSRYGRFRDIFKALYDLKIVIDNPNNMLSACLTKLGLSQFLYVTTNIDFVIASAILSLYPGADFVDNLLINRKLQESIEDIIVKYSNTTGLNLDLVSKL